MSTMFNSITEFLFFAALVALWLWRRFSVTTSLGETDGDGDGDGCDGCGCGCD